MTTTTEPAIYRLSGYLGIRSAKMRPNVQLDLQDRLSLKGRAWRDFPPSEVQAYFVKDNYFWVPRFYFDGSIQSGKVGKHPIQFDWIDGAPIELTNKVILDPNRGQPAAVDAMEIYLRHNTGGILVAPTGCISGDTHIAFEVRDLDGSRVSHRGGPLERLYRWFNKLEQTDGGTRWRKDVAFFVPSATDDDTFRLNKVEAVVDSGEKQVFRVTTSSGKSLKATSNHEFMTENGFRPLAKLSVGDRVCTYSGKPQRRGGRKAAPYRKEVFVKYHPTASTKVVNGCTYYRLRVYQAVYEARQNNLTYGDYIALLNSGDLQAGRRLWTIPDGHDVHHLDENHENNAIENLALVRHGDHATQHHGAGPKRFVEVDTIVNIESLGVEHVYDIVCADPYRNFVAGGVVVHNCGKTILGYSVAHKFETSIGVLVYNGHMLDNWIKTADQVFGLKPYEVGVVQGEQCDLGKPVTIMMIQSLLARNYPKELYEQIGFLIGDECLTGDALVETNAGPVAIADIPSSGATEVLSFNERTKGWQLKRIKRWIPRGCRKTLLVKAGTTTIRCTPEHPFLTDQGWLLAGQLRPGHRVLSPVRVDAAPNSSIGMPEEGRGGSYPSTSVNYNVLSLKRPVSSAEGCSKQRLLSADVVAAGRCSSLVDSRRIDVAHQDGPNTLSDTTEPSFSEQQCLQKHLVSSTEHYLETQESTKPKEPGLVHASTSIMGRSSRPGPTSKPLDSTNSVARPRLSRMVASAIRHALVAVVAILRYLKSCVWLDSQNLSMPIGSHSSLMRDGLGGSWMMGQLIEVVSDSARKASAGQRSKSSRIPFGEWDFLPSSLHPRDVTGSSDFACETPFDGSSDSGNTSPQEWNTNFLKITEIIVDQARGSEQVFDLEVEDNHNFVANGFLVHNCPRLGAPQWNEVLKLFPAKYRLGLSADPKRDDGLDKLIEWHFGKVGHRIGTTTAKPDVVQVCYKVNYDARKFFDWGTTEPNPVRYDKVLQKDKGRNEFLVGELVKARIAGRRILIFSRFVDHLKDLKSSFDMAWDLGVLEQLADESIPFRAPTKTTLLVGGLTDTRREDAMGGDVIFTTFAFARDALNLPTIDTLMFATPPGKVLQPIGRLRDKGSPDRRPLLAIDPYELPDYSRYRARSREKAYNALGLKVIHAEQSAKVPQ
jgi:hypothetical protein